MRILIAPDKFKGSLSADQAARAIAAGFLKVFPDAECELAPIAVGGEGTAAIFQEILGGEEVSCPAHDALGRPVEASYVFFPDREMALLEMSQASGMWRLDSNDLDPMRASTHGTGELMQDAIRRGARTLYVALGGSATNDAGIGAAAALGWRFFDSGGAEIIPIPSNFSSISRIFPPPVASEIEVIGLCDVQSPLLGPDGASRMFGPQKGATPEQVETLESALAHVADLCRDQLGPDHRESPGAGATGGLGFGILTFCSGRLEPGFDAVSRLINLPERIRNADLVVTAEGRIDRQTEHGKGPAAVARLARSCGRPVIAFAGKIDDRLPIFDACLPITNGAMTLDESRLHAAELLQAAAERAASLLKISL